VAVGAGAQDSKPQPKARQDAILPPDSLGLQVLPSIRRQDVGDVTKLPVESPTVS
jgi:hypothetical protein